jgi:hypothetical protein
VPQLVRQAWMIEIRHQGGERYTVTICDSRGASHHDVTARAADLTRLGGGHRAEAVVEAAFKFLLDREPKESILPAFDLMVIARYFPEFEAALAEYF